MSANRIKKPLLAGHHRPASERPLKWRFSGVPMMSLHWIWIGSFVILKGIRTRIAKKPYIFVIYRGGGGGGGPDPLSPPLDPPMMLVIRVHVSVDESSSSMLYLFQVVDISVVVWLPDNVWVFKACGRAKVSPTPRGSVLPWSLKIMHWSPQIPERIFLSSLKVFFLCSPNP